MVKKALAALALYTAAAEPTTSKNQIVDDLNEFSLQELLEFREKILEHKQNIESRPESDEVDVGGDEQGLESNEVEDIDSLR